MLFRSHVEIQRGQFESSRVDSSGDGDRTTEPVGRWCRGGRQADSYLLVFGVDEEEDFAVCSSVGDEFVW